MATTTYLIAVSNGLATLPDKTKEFAGRGMYDTSERVAYDTERARRALIPKCKHCSNSPYKDSEYCYPHMVAEERANE